ncbi:MAG: filamentous hemagglutinin N-terminal domain-containing protein [Acidaminococcaceae bacterium]|jgi:filamentous hemagglutinin family protein|nr:filamentous hemagglutinin N-terminal domain-containing protein [Acidaminococcaceae bacterium]
MDKYKRTNLKKHITLALLLSMAVVTPRAYALPGQGQYQSANEVKAVINSTSNSMNITGNQTNTALNWESFNVAKAESVNFKGADKNYLNLIHDANASKIMGALNGDGGKIYLINPNGVLFGAEAKVNMGAGSLVASTRPFRPGGNSCLRRGRQSFNCFRG